MVLSVTTRWALVRHWWVVTKEAITIAVVTDGCVLVLDVAAGYAFVLRPCLRQI